jgi:hypothetical protein
MTHEILSFMVVFAVIIGGIYREEITFWSLHAFCRLNRGAVRQEVEHRGGRVREYESGYVEFETQGETWDCVIAERRHLIAWRCYGVGAHTGGCTGEFFTPPMKQKDAEKYVTERGHSVEFVDADKGFIFYRDRK